jgi:ammonia channel protein AmtB
MATKYILAGLAALFLALAIGRLAAGGPRSQPQNRTWLLIGVIFGAVSAWLFFQE